MTEVQLDLARRAVACKGWRWMPGMLTGNNERVVRVEHDGYTHVWYAPHRIVYATYGLNTLPDLTDPATLGCLLALVREAWQCPVITSPDYDYDDEARQGPNVVGWRAVETERWMTAGEAETEAEALVAALEAAP